MAKLYHQVFAVLFVILRILWMSKGAKYRMIPGNFTMAEAPDKCQLATPELIFTSSGIQLNMTTDEFYPDDGEKFWTGYVNVFQAFQYRVKYFPSTTCASADDQKLCLAWNADILEYTWSSCSNNHSLVCQQEKSDFIYTLSSWSTIMQECLKYNYLPALRLTNFTRTLWPTRTTLWIGEVRDKIIAMDSNHSSGMGLQRSYAELQNNVFHLRFDDDTNQHRVMCYGEDTATGSSSSSTTSIDPADEKVTRSIATTDMPYNTSISTATLIGPTIETVTGSKTTTDMPYNTSISTETSVNTIDEEGQRSITTINKPNNTTVTSTARHEATTIDESTNKDNSVPLIVGVSVAVSVLVMLVVTVLCVVKKRMKTNKKQPDHEMETREMRVEHNDATAATEIYFVLEPSGSGKRHEMSPVGDVVYDTAEEREPQGNDDRLYRRPESDGTYNVTTDNVAKGKQPTENIYNKTEADDTYDHTGATPRKIQTDNVYNVTEFGDIYNQAGVPLVRKVQTDNVYNMTETDDTYSHTDRVPTTATVTDNVYN